VTSISTKRLKKNAELQWTDTTKEKPPGDTLVVGVYKYYTEDEDWEWDYNFMYYDEREFWVDDDMCLAHAPLYWVLVTPPKEK
jgi:hypothetical protein